MKKKFNLRRRIVIVSMLFGMFFGAGNLIFPAKLGIDAGANMPLAYIGMFITAVGLPLMAVAALGISRSDGVIGLAGKVGKKYSIFFCTLLYLTIGPLFAIPRCASTSFSVGAVNLIDGNQTLALAIFSFVFFVGVLIFSLWPNKIMIWIGRILNPLFLAFLALLIVVALINPIGSIQTAPVAESYATSGGAFFSGFLEGYNTLDALAGLAFGIVVVDTIKLFGEKDPNQIAKQTSFSGIFSCLFMGIIYFFITLVATNSSSICAGCEDGGSVLGVIANHYFGVAGAWIMTAIVTLACFKTAIGLITSCATAFTQMFPKGPKYNVWAIIFCAVSFLIANLGLSTIVAFCVPVLMFLYPLAITLILLALFGKFFKHDKTIYVWTTGFALFAAIFDFINALSGTLQGAGVQNTSFLDSISAIAAKVLPFFSIGLGWVCPAALGCIIGIIIYLTKKKSQTA